MSKHRAVTVAFVGVDGSGKSTLSRRIAAALAEQGRVVHEVKIRSGRSGLDRQAAESGYTDLADMVGPETAVMMLAAVTWQSVRDVKPLRRDPDAVVLLDRSTHCVLALAALLAPGQVEIATRLFAPLPTPDVVVHVRVRPDVAIARLAARGGTPQSAAFLDAFDAAYRGLPDAGGFVQIDGDGDPDDVFWRTSAALQARLGARWSLPQAP